MIGMITRRLFHTGKMSMAVSKSSVLAKLRKSTGYTVSNCKKAIEMFPDDVHKAEEWLHAEAKNKGWAKWSKIQGRSATQGLIGVCTQGNIGVMVEVNCETDFVARNADFQQFVEKMISGCMNVAENLSVDAKFSKIILEETQLNSVKCETASLGELLVAAAFKFGEKTVAKRAVCLKVENDILLSSLAHPSTQCSNLKGGSLGKYGVLLALKKNETDITEDVHSVECNICQHIIGMNPLSVGELTDKDIQKFIAKKESDEDMDVVANETEEIQLKESEREQMSRKDVLVNETVQESQKDAIVNEVAQNSQKSEAEESDSEESDTEDREDVDTKLKDSEEVRLLFQPYLLDSSVTPGEVLFKSGLEVITFERLECGESVDEAVQPPEVAQSVGA